MAISFVDLPIKKKKCFVSIVLLVYQRVLRGFHQHKLPLGPNIERGGVLIQLCEDVKEHC